MASTAAMVLLTNPSEGAPYRLTMPSMCGATEATPNAKVGFVFASPATASGRRTTNPKTRIDSLSVFPSGSAK